VEIVHRNGSVSYVLIYMEFLMASLVEGKE
jgi:hypothetical protein